MDGFLCIDKPVGLTSFEIIKQLRKIYKEKKIGHCGTLDPAASGLLLCGFGQATRLLQYVPDEPKVYRFSIQFGSTTDSLDATGAMTQTGMPIPGQEEIAMALQASIGPSMQVPPQVSAIKVDGVRAYVLARSQHHFELPARPISIYQAEMVHYDRDAGQAHCRISCSGGTYVRALARDIAFNLGTVGYACDIRREAIGPFPLEKSHRFESVEQQTALIPIVEFLSCYPTYICSLSEAEKIKHGHAIECRNACVWASDHSIDRNNPPFNTSNMVFIFNEKNCCIAFGQVSRGNSLQPKLVFRAEQ
ncbi:MAG: tRNA pseudouridine(55) synthase TruB [Chitinivibrionales bacterium]|nr:tRNA pseudouridine(55) synthase TruB [Chitinivibrionales bacterium]